MRAIIGSALMALTVTTARAAEPIEYGTFLDPRVLPRRPPPIYQLPQLQALARSGQLDPSRIAKLYKEITNAQQPMSMPFLGGELTWNPSEPAQQTYIATPKEAPVKVCGGEFTYSYWINSKGVMHVPHIFDEKGREWSVGDYQIKSLTELYETGSLDATPEKVTKVRECLTRAMDYLHLR
jgi:hypothetical protein